MLELHPALSFARQGSETDNKRRVAFLPFAETSPHQFPRAGLRLETVKILLAHGAHL